MKKLLFLSIIALFAFASANVYGQNTGDLPSVGSKHQYWVNGPIGAPTSGATSTYTWWVSTSSANLLTPVTSPTEFSPTSGYNLGAVGQNGIEITWNPSSAGKTYYLVVQETGVAPLCTNIKAYAIQPKNDFTLIFAMLAQDGTTLGDNLSRCAPDIAVTASGTTITYNYGSDNYLYKLTANGLYTSWVLDYAFTNTLNGATPTFSYSTDGGTTYTTKTATETALSIPASTTGTKDVLIRVNLNNGTTNEGTTAQTMKLTLSNVKDSGGNAVNSIKNNAGSPTTNQTQTVKARPATIGIQSN
jgi:hypothetical protein